MDRQTAYKVLNLADNASEEEVKAAYKHLAQKYGADGYDAGPLRDEAEKKMDELNDAFDAAMGYLRTGQTTQPTAPGGSAAPVGRYSAIRQLINNNRVDEALAELNSVQNGAADAEWNFLMGSAYYYKGWLDQALAYFTKAASLEPSNPEYAAALRNLQNSANGQMPNSPYYGQNSSAQAVNCACNTCTTILCMDACCSCMRGC